jgi:hypothetical protein
MTDSNGDRITFTSKDVTGSAIAIGRGASANVNSPAAAAERQFWADFEELRSELALLREKIESGEVTFDASDQVVTELYAIEGQATADNRDSQRMLPRLERVAANIVNAGTLAIFAQQIAAFIAVHVH